MDYTHVYKACLVLPCTAKQLSAAQKRSPAVISFLFHFFILIVSGSKVISLTPSPSCRFSYGDIKVILTFESVDEVL